MTQVSEFVMTGAMVGETRVFAALGHAARAAMAKAGGPAGYTLMLGGEERDVRSRSLRAGL
jgi:hypothetical protein